MPEQNETQEVVTVAAVANPVDREAEGALYDAVYLKTGSTGEASAAVKARREALK